MALQKEDFRDQGMADFDRKDAAVKSMEEGLLTDEVSFL